MTNRVYLLRHAKAKFAEPGIKDFDRALDKTGLRDAQATGREMRQQQYLPDLVLFSPAKRAKQTWTAVAAAFEKEPESKAIPELYDQDAAGYLQIIRNTTNVASLMLVGHNPMMEDLALVLARAGDSLADQIQRAGFPTSGLAVLEFDNALAHISEGSGRIVHLLKPAD